MKKYDIIVAGGGFAGAAAAISAARLGKKVLLFDKSNCLGGAACNCLVFPFMPYTTRVDGEIKRLSAGLFHEIQIKEQDLSKLIGDYNNDPKKEHEQPAENEFGEETLKLVLNRMATDAGVELLYHAYLCGVDTENGKIKSVTVSTKSGNIELFADMFIDATGDADLAVRVGCPYHLGRPQDELCQPMTLCFRVTNVDVKAFFADSENWQKLYKQYQSEGKITNPRENILVFRPVTNNVIHFNTTRVIKLNPVDPFDVTKAELMAREQVFEVYDLLKKHAKGFEKAQLMSTAAEIGVRESRMIDGEYLLTGEDLLHCARFDDSIATGNYDIDIHNPEGTGTSHHYFAPGEFYEIPYRTLVPKSIDNLLVAGRCSSFDHEAQASVRIMPIVCCLGEAAGVAASVALDGNNKPVDADVKKIQKILVDNGATIH